MKVKIEDFLLAMGEYCKEHSPEECASCTMSVDHEDPGDGTVFYGCVMFGCEYPKYAKMVKKEILKYMGYRAGGSYPDIHKDGKHRCAHSRIARRKSNDEWKLSI